MVASFFPQRVSSPRQLAYSPSSAKARQILRVRMTRATAPDLRNVRKVRHYGSSMPGPYPIRSGRSKLPGYCFGQGSFAVTVTSSPLWKVSSDLTGKPPLGHVLGRVR